VAFTGDENARLRSRLPLEERSSAVQKRRRFKQAQTPEERLAEEARSLRETAKTLPPGAERDLMLRKARRDETALHVTDWLNSPGLKPPT
jgi:hypothetical protein